MKQKQQNCAGNFSSIICLGKNIENKSPSEILYQTTIKKENKENSKKQLIKELKNYISTAQILYSSEDELRKIRYFLYKNKTPQEKIEYIQNLLLKHANNVGLNQAIKDLQRSLSILNKNRKNSPINSKNILKEDGIFGEKTKATLKNICKNFDLFTIKKYFLKGIINNIIFDTKNKQNIDTEELIYTTIKVLKEY